MCPALVKLCAVNTAETVLRFLECIVAKSLVNENIFEKNFKFAMLL